MFILTTWPVSWETYVQVRKQQLELDMEQQTDQEVWYSHLLQNFPVYCDHVLKYKETEVQIIFCNKVFLCACLPSLFSHVQLFAILWTSAHQAPLSMGFSRQEC